MTLRLMGETPARRDYGDRIDRHRIPAAPNQQNDTSARNTPPTVPTVPLGANPQTPGICRIEPAAC